MSALRLRHEGPWDLQAEAAPRRGTRTGSDGLLDALAAAGPLSVAGRYLATARPRRGAAPAPLLLHLESGGAHVVAVRHASGALSFHAGERPAPGQERFLLPLAAPGGRRGPVTGAIRVVVFEAAALAADAALPDLAARWEGAWWARSGRSLGLVKVTAEGLRAGRLPPVDDPHELAPPPRRSLLLLHGTFSSAEGAFASLARGAFFEAAAELYGDRVFAFNHATVSVPPEQNARELLLALPPRPLLADVITHSRGGLLLRTLVERRELLGHGERHLRAGRVVLAAAPNRGTPLATPARFDRSLGLLANLLDLFPDNPFSAGLSFLAEGLGWLAHRLAGSLPGLAAMDAHGETIAALAASPGPGGAEYSALVADFRPDAGLAARLADAGLDAFFEGPNDLVVPTEGGHDVGRPEAPSIPAERIGRFGPGGNLAADGPVHHLNLFQQPASLDFLLRALRGPAVEARATRGAPAVASAPRPRGTEPGPPGARAPRGCPLELFVIGADDGSDDAQLLASYRNARVLEPFRKRGEAAGARWREIIATQRRIKGFVAGEPGHEALPDAAGLREFGARLFDTLFPGEVRRLYDAARAGTGSGRLDVVFTSMIDWVADLPWELAYDPGRRTFLAVEEVNFLRNVYTAVPAEAREPGGGPLRILVAVAQPLGLPVPSAEAEAESVQAGFSTLVEAGLARVEVLAGCTPERLHARLQEGGLDVLHFIGHGERGRGEDGRTGHLLFEEPDGSVRRLDAERVRRLLLGRGLRLLFLNACETGAGGTADVDRGVAPALVAGGMSAVVANQYRVLDASASAFARHFYAALAGGVPLADAAREARVAVDCAGAVLGGDAIDWAVPVLFARDPGEVLCRGGAVAALSRPAPIRRLRRGGGERVGLWDLHRALPRLRALAARLAADLPGRSFPLLDLPAPHFAWRGGPAGSLDPAPLAARLQDRLGELGVERLIVLTLLRLTPPAVVGPEGLAVWSQGPVACASLAGAGGDVDEALAACLARLVESRRT